MLQAAVGEGAQLMELRVFEMAKTTPLVRGEALLSLLQLAPSLRRLCCKFHLELGPETDENGEEMEAVGPTFHMLSLLPAEGDVHLVIHPNPGFALAEEEVAAAFSRALSITRLGWSHENTPRMAAHGRPRKQLATKVARNTFSFPKLSLPLLRGLAHSWNAVARLDLPTLTLDPPLEAALLELIRCSGAGQAGTA